MALVRCRAIGVFPNRRVPVNSLVWPIRIFDWKQAICVVGALMVASANRVSGAAGTESWTAGPGFRWSRLNMAQPGKVGFTLLTPEATDLRFTNRLSEAAGAENRVLYNGAGVASGDINQDGRPDLFFCDLSGHNALFLNLGGWRFREATQESGLATPLPASRGAAFADLNGDGALDLLVSVNGRGVRVFLNDGRGRFVDGTAAAGTAHDDGSTTLALAGGENPRTCDPKQNHAPWRSVGCRDFAVAVRTGGESGRSVALPGRRCFLVHHAISGAPKAIASDCPIRCRASVWSAPARAGAMQDETHLRWRCTLMEKPSVTPKAVPRGTALHTLARAAHRFPNRQIRPLPSGYPGIREEALLPRCELRGQARRAGAAPGYIPTSLWDVRRAIVPPQR